MGGELARDVAAGVAHHEDVDLRVERPGGGERLQRGGVEDPAVVVGDDEDRHQITPIFWKISTRAGTASALSAQIQGGTPDGAYDLVICGTEAGDTADYQVPVRIAHALGWPVVTNVKGLAITDGVARCERAVGSQREVYEVALPAVISVKDGVNIPRYPSVPGRIKARKKPVDTVAGERPAPRLEKVRLDLVAEETRSAEVLGTGPEAVPALVEIFQKIGVI